jgi:DNA sulfur modification protein DndB
LPPAKAEEFGQTAEYVLDTRRAVEISKYLTTNEDRFFNSLVLAVYGGRPDWLGIGIISADTPNASLLSEVSEEAKDSIGFLRLSGGEKLFAIDGQHRLAGIKQAIVSDDALINEFVPAILVGHKNTPSGVRRTRCLFASLHRRGSTYGMEKARSSKVEMNERHRCRIRRSDQRIRGAL